MLALALWLTLAPGSAHRSLDRVAEELAENGATLARAGAWLHAHLTNGVMVGSAVLAWLDALSTGIEGILLLSGRAWAQWLVIAGLGALIPVELLSLERRPGPGKWIVLAVNVAIVVYLVQTRRRDASHERAQSK